MTSGTKRVVSEAISSSPATARFCHHEPWLSAFGFPALHGPQTFGQFEASVETFWAQFSLQHEQSQPMMPDPLP